LFQALKQITMHRQHLRHLYSMFNGRLHISTFTYHPLNGTLGLAAFDDDTVDWFKTTALNIWWHNLPLRLRSSIPSAVADFASVCKYLCWKTVLC